MPCVGYAKSMPDEGSVNVERPPHPPSLRHSRCCIGILLVTAAGDRLCTLSDTGSGVPPADHGVIETGEKSTNQLFGCTNPLTFGLMARGATSWAT